MKQLALAILLVFFTVLIKAADSDGKFQVHGIGFDSCGKFLVASSKISNRKKKKALKPYIIWLEGYMTAYNAMNDNTFSLDTQIDSSERMAFIDTYCRKKPLDAYFKAVLALTEELHPKRVQSAPKK